MRQFIDIIIESENVPARLFHGTSVLQFEKMKASRFNTREIYFGDEPNNICEHYAVSQANADGSDPLIIEVDSNHLDGSIDPDIHAGNDDAEGGQYIFRGNFASAIVRAFAWGDDGEYEVEL